MNVQNVKKANTKAQTDFRFCVIGGGVAGLAIAYQLSQHGSVIVLERHPITGSETSSRNSEVIHAGLYYPAGSLKESLCLRGKQLLYEFCEQFQVPHQRIGKLIVSQHPDDAKLRQLEHKAKHLNIPLERLNQRQLQQKEPEVRGQAALFSPTTGIIDSHAYMQTLAHQAQLNGALIMCQSEFIGAEHQREYWSVKINTADGPFTFTTQKIINSAGLSAQQVAQHFPVGQRTIPELYPCRGHYFSYSGSNPFHHLIYPLPEANLAGLGIHATIDLGKQLRFGPDTEYLEEGSLSYEVNEQRLKDKFCRAIRQYYPQVDSEKLHADYAGIRPKLHLQHQNTADFVFQHNRQVMHLFGIESPGLTASLAIAERVTQWATSPV